jgi:hypothetical protein
VRAFSTHTVPHPSKRALSAAKLWNRENPMRKLSNSGEQCDECLTINLTNSPLQQGSSLAEHPQLIRYSVMAHVIRGLKPATVPFSRMPLVSDSSAGDSKSPREVRDWRCGGPAKPKSIESRMRAKSCDCVTWARRTDWLLTGILLPFPTSSGETGNQVQDQGRRATLTAMLPMPQYLVS